MADLKHISDLRPDEKNANRGTQRGTGMLEDSLRKHGAGRSILIDRAGIIIAGNKTYEQAGALGIEDVIVVPTDGTKLVAVQRTDLDINDPRTRELAIADNRVGQVNLEWDPAVLAELAQEGVALTDLWREEELAELLAPVTATPAPGGGGDEFDTTPQEGPTVCQPGDLWQLGKHRLLCGDSTKREDVERLMDGEKAALTMTSPPYWVGKEYEKQTTWSEVLEFISAAAAVICTVTDRRIVINTGAPQAAHLTGLPAHTRLLLDDWVRALEVHGFLLRYSRIWAKRGGLAHTAPSSDCIDQHWEFIAVFYRPDRYEGQRRLGEPWATDGIWDDLPGTMNEAGHCASFPVEIPARNIRLYTDTGAIIFEPFMGAGTTLIAAERLGRRCYGIEIEPRYCDVILRRYEAETGQQPVLIAHGSPD